MKKALLFRLLGFWPPYLGAGIKVTRVGQDLRRIDVEMKARPWNRNYVGVHFGGSLYAMTDPFYMLMLLENLGRNYIVWDKAASIRFKKPGKGLMRASFELNEEVIEEIRREADLKEKSEPRFYVKVLDETGEVVAEVEKLLSVRRKDKARTSAKGRAS